MRVLGWRTLLGSAHFGQVFVALHTKPDVRSPGASGETAADCETAQFLHGGCGIRMETAVTTADTIAIEDTSLGTLEAEHRLPNAVLKEPLPRPGRFGFRGDIALAFQDQVADEKRPPAYAIEQVLAVADAATGRIPVMAGYLHNFAWLRDAGEVLADHLDPGGTYVFFVNNIDFLKKYRVPLNAQISAYVLPLDESTVWKEALELVGVDRNDVKRMGGAQKLEFVLDRIAAFAADYPELSYEEGVATMAPVRNRNENRPV